ncbi:hypothetical protein [Paenibacillus albidus]|uniref:hypothetical protein n=1 Tax=Paenibacillus albidus TaxID=2041023 RepID=UPI001668E1FB|nr:hypothetical protein [Paenibacillus albidus]
MLCSTARSYVVADDAAVKHIDHVKDKKEAVVAMNISILNVNLPELVGASDHSIPRQTPREFHVPPRLLLEQSELLAQPVCLLVVEDQGMLDG